MTDNTALWDKLGKTDPKHTKSFKRSGGFSGTAIKPMWAYRRMTEEFGPCGKGWGVFAPSFEVVNGADGEVLVYCTASIWYEQPGQMAFGVGGDKVVGKNRHGLTGDDEAFKKAFTDAITNALKMIGVGADVHMGLYDDNKYVNSLKSDFPGEPAPQPASPAYAQEAAGDEAQAELARLIALANDKTKHKSQADLERFWNSDDVQDFVNHNPEELSNQIVAAINTRLKEYSRAA